MKNNENILYIEDANKRKLFYRFTPAAITSNFVPLVVVLEDEEKTADMNFEYKMWNMLTPIYPSNKKEDSWAKDLLQKLIKKIAEDLECEEHIYIYGSSMQGYRAILHGILGKVNALFADTSHINKADITDLSNFLNAKDSFPIFYLCAGETKVFADACKKHGLICHLDFCPESKEDNEKHILKEVLDMFERMVS